MVGWFSSLFLHKHMYICIQEKKAAYWIRHFCIRLITYYLRLNITRRYSKSLNFNVCSNISIRGSPPPFYTILMKKISKNQAKSSINTTYIYYIYKEVRYVLQNKNKNHKNKILLVLSRKVNYIA